MLNRVNERAKVAGAINKVWVIRSLGINLKKIIYESLVMPTVLYGAEMWGLNASNKKRLNVMEMKCLRGVTVRNLEKNRSKS